MSNYLAPTRHPITGVVEQAEWLDDYVDRHCYGVRFPSDGKIYDASLCEEVPMTDDLVKRLREASRQYIDNAYNLHARAADRIEQQKKRNQQLEAALLKIASNNSVKAGTDADMYKRWRRVATDGIDIARAALREKKDV